MFHTNGQNKLLCNLWQARPGASIPRGNDAFPPLFQISPCFRIIFWLRRKFPKFWKSWNIFRFSAAKISDDFFIVITHKFRIPPIFAMSIHFPPISKKLFFPLFSANVHVFYMLYVFFVPPYFMHHTMHVLDAPGPGIFITKNVFCTIDKIK